MLNKKERESIFDYLNSVEDSVMMGAARDRLQEQSLPENLNGVVEVSLGISTRTGRRNNSCSAESSMSSLPASSLSLSEFTTLITFASSALSR